MARPYQDAVDQFMADYQDKFFPTLITGKGTAESPYTNMGGPETAIPMTKDQVQLERDKLLASSIHPDTFGKVLDVMRGKGTPGSPFTNLSGPEKAIPNQPAMGGPYNPQLNRPALPELFKRFAAYNPEITTPEAQQLLIPAEPTPFTVGGTTSGTLDQLRAAYGANYPDPVTGIIPGGGRGGFGKTFMPTGKDVIDMENLGRKPIPTPRWDYKGELAKQGTYSFEPEADYLKRTGRTALPTPDEAARIAMNVAPAIPTGSPGWNVHLPGGGSYWETPEMNARSRAESGGGGGYEMPGEIKTALQDIQKILMTPSPSQDIWSPGGNIRFPGGYGKAQKDTLANLAGTLTGYQARMAEIGVRKGELGVREGELGVREREIGVHEKALPSEIDARMAEAVYRRSQIHGPILSADQSMWMNGKWITAPGRTKPVQELMEGIRKSSMKVDPNTGAQLGFDEATFKGTMRAYVKAGLLTHLDVNPDYLKMSKEEFKAGMTTKAMNEKRKIKPKDIDEAWGIWQKSHPQGY